MKKTITVGIIFFVIGSLVGFGADRVYMRRKSATAYEQMQPKTAENNQDVAGAGANIGPETSTASDTSGEGTAGKNESASANIQVNGQTAGPSFTGEASPSTGKNSVLVEDQKPGSKVTIQSVTLGVNGWVVIHDDANGKPGHILGARRLNAGTYTGQSVELLKETAEGKVYYAMLHADDGDKQFDYRVDLPIKDETGNQVMVRFVATKSSAL